MYTMSNKKTKPWYCEVVQTADRTLPELDQINLINGSDLQREDGLHLATALYDWSVFIKTLYHIKRR